MLLLSAGPRCQRLVFLSIAVAVMVVGVVAGVVDAEAISDIELIAGQSQVISVPNLDTVAVGDETIADVVVSGRDEFLLNGKQAGVTTLVIWTGEERQACRVSVLPRDRPTASELREVLGPDCTYTWVGTTLVVSGEVSASERAAVDRALQTLWPDTLNLIIAKVESPERRFAAAEAAFARLTGSLFPKIETQRADNVLLIRGTVERARDVETVKELAANLGLTPVMMVKVENSDWQEALKLPIQLGLSRAWVQRVGDLLILRGSVDDLGEKQALVEVAGHYGQVVDVVRVMPQTQAKANTDGEGSDPSTSLVRSEIDIKRLHRILGMPKVKLELVEGKLLVYGSVNTPAEAAAAEKIAAAFADTVVNGIIISPAQSASGAAGEQSQIADVDTVAATLSNILSALGYDQVQVTDAGAALVLQGKVSTDKERELLEGLTDGFGYPVVNAVEVDVLLGKSVEPVLQFLEGQGVKVVHLQDGRVFAFGKVRPDGYQTVIRVMDQIYPGWIDALSADHEDVNIAKETYLLEQLPPGVSARFIRDTVLLSGVCSTQRRDSIQQLAEGLWSQVINLITVPQVREPIQIQVRIIEVEDSSLDELGLEWASDYQQPTKQPAALHVGEDGLTIRVPAPLGNYELTPTLQAMAAEGKVRTLAAPTLVFTSGSSASFLAGGQIPLPVKSEEHTSIEWRDYGVKLNVSGLVEDDRISIELEPEVSILDWNNAVNIEGVEMPAIKVRKAKTQVYVDSGQSIILGGLLGEEQRKSVERVPFLGSLPILGRLFRSERYQQSQSDLVIILTPGLPGSSPVGQDF